MDYILEFAAGDTEKTLSLTTEADSVNEGDGWLAVSILQRTGVPYTVETGRAQVHVKDDDIPTVSLTQPVGPTGLTLSSNGTTWEGEIVEGTQFTYNSTCTGVTEFSEDASVNLVPVSMYIQYSNHPAFYGEQNQNQTLGYNRAGILPLGRDCNSRTVTYSDHRFYVGPENGVLEIEIVPRSELLKVEQEQEGGPPRYRPRLFAELDQQYEAAATEAQAAGTLITKKNIFHPSNLGGYHPRFACNESDLRYCPQYRVGTVKKIRLTIINRDPTILIKADSASVAEGQPARFILERKWAADLLELDGSTVQSETVVYLRASQDGQYITGALPSQDHLRPERDPQGHRTPDRGRLGLWRQRIGDHRAAARHLHGQREPAWQVHDLGELAGPYPGREDAPTGPPSPSPTMTINPESPSPRRRPPRATRAAPT